MIFIAEKLHRVCGTLEALLNTEMIRPGNLIGKLLWSNAETMKAGTVNVQRTLEKYFLKDPLLDQ